MQKENKRIHPDKDRCLKAIQAHLVTHGSGEWDLLFAQFPHIPQGSIFRWIKDIRSGKKDAPALRTARAKIKVSLAKDIENNVPVAPSPSYIAESGERGVQNLDFLVEIRRIYADANMLRKAAVKAERDENGEEQIKNPMLFDRSIQRRADLLTVSLKAMQEVWDLKKMQIFYQTIIEEIGQADRDTQHRILIRLAKVNSEYGMTMDMQV